MAMSEINEFEEERAFVERTQNAKKAKSQNQF